MRWLKKSLPLLPICLFFLLLDSTASAQKHSSIRKTAPVSATPKLLPDNQGHIQRLLLNFADYDIIPTLYTLLKQLSHDTTITIFAPAGERTKLLNALIQGWAIKSPPKIEIVSLDEEMTFWIRDEFVVADQQTLILPRRFGNRGMPASIEKISKTQKLKTVNSLVEFDGGNVLVSKEYVFVGYNLIKDNLGDLFSSQAEIENYLQRLFGRPIIVVGNATTPVPHEHIDMILTPLGGKRLLLGDPRLATAELAKHRNLLTTPYSKIYFNEQVAPIPPIAKKILFATEDFVARLQQDLGVGKASDINRDADINLALLYTKNALPSNLALFDNLEKDLRNKGFTEIYRVPVLMNHDLENGPFITYNNMLLDEVVSKRRIFLPDYNITPLDQLAVETLKKLGYEVKSIDVQNISFYNGTLRCITQVLNRNP